MVTRADAHKPEFHRDDAWKQPVRCATTAPITIATDLNVGDTIDGVTLAAGDRVLVKDQAAGAENGIYDAGATPVRSYDMDTGLEVVGCLVHVVAGTANGGKLYRNTNTSAVTVDTTAITFDELTSGGGLTIEEVDGTPTVAATKLVLPNGTLGVVGTVATYTPPGGGGGDSVGQFVVGWDGGGAFLVANNYQDVVALFDGTITGWTLLADQSGSAVVDIWADTYANFAPTVGDSITAAAKPTLSSTAKAQGSPTGWTDAITAGRIYRFHLDSVSALTKLVLVVDYSRP